MMNDMVAKSAKPELSRLHQNSFSYCARTSQRFRRLGGTGTPSGTVLSREHGDNNHDVINEPVGVSATCKNKAACEFVVEGLPREFQHDGYRNSQDVRWQKCLVIYTRCSSAPENQWHQSRFNIVQ